MLTKIKKLFISDKKDSVDKINESARFKNDFEKLQIIISNAASSAAKNSEKLKINSDKTKLVVLEVNQATESTRELKTQFDNVVNLTNSSFEKNKMTLNSCSSGLNITNKNNIQVVELKKNMDETVLRINSLVENLKGILEISKTIQNVAFQTKLLAFNASVEAARAGEHGKGFSIVAQEIQKLGEHTNQETKVILELLNKINADLGPSKKSLAACTELVESTSQITSEVNTFFQQIANQVGKTSENMSHISQLNLIQKDQISSMFEKIQTVEKYIIEIKKNSDELEKNNRDLSADTENAFEIFGNYDVGSFFNLTLNRAYDLQNFFERTVLKHISLGDFKMEDVLNSDYIEVTRENLYYVNHLFDSSDLNTDSFNPPKFIRTYEKHIDSELIQYTDEILSLDSKYKFILYTDFNGKSITHNKMYIQKWTNQYDSDLLKNRVKRFFDSSDVLLRGSRFGLAHYKSLPLRADRATLEKICGVHDLTFKNKYLVQTYLRDTGEVMTVLSMPLYIESNYIGAIFIAWSEV